MNKYPKIFESSGKWRDFKVKKNQKFVITEKIHGANFSFIVDKESMEIRYGKRKEVLKDSDYFYGFRKMTKRYDEKVIEVCKILGEKDERIEKVIVFGELFGGFYPSDKLDDKGNIDDIVQSGIYYCHNIEFYAFDIGIVLQNKKFKFLDYLDSIQIFEDLAFIFAKPLFIGSFQDCLKYKLGFNSTIPAYLGLPPLQKENLAEGIVIKPLIEFYVKNSKGEDIRPILKRKIERFSEKLYDDAKKNTNKINQFKNDANELVLLTYELDAIIVENRLINAISKIGKIDRNNQKRMKSILKEFKNDVFSEFLEDNSEEWEKLNQSDKNIVKDDMLLKCKNIIIKYLKKNQRNKKS